MGIKRKRVGPEPIEKRDQWEIAADAGQRIKAIWLARQAGYLREAAIKLVEKRMNQRKK